MRFNDHWTGITIFAAALGVGACSGAARSQPQTGGASAANAEVEAIYRARTDSARMRYTEADVRFITNMIAHHAQALVMARLAPSHGASPAVLTLAARIVNAQNDEIALMQQWLRERALPVPEVGADPAHGAGHAGHMPGMLTAEQLRQLEQARNTQFDRLFLTLMIQHHRGAVTMVNELFDAGGAGRDDLVFKIASDAQVDQITEINRMEKLLATLPRGLP